MFQNFKVSKLQISEFPDTKLSRILEHAVSNIVDLWDFEIYKHIIFQKGFGIFFELFP